MHTQEVYINGERCDMSDNTPVAITCQVNNLAEIKDRQSTYTNSIKLPKTARNKSILGHADNDSFTQHTPYTVLKTKIVQDGVEVIPSGGGNLQRVTDNFEVQITYGVSSFLDIIGNYKLNEIDYDDIPRPVWNMATIAASQTAASGLIWPAIDYGKTLDTSAGIDIQYMRPGVFIWQILDAIANYTKYEKPSEPSVFYSGYQFRGGILSNPIFLRDFIPMSQTKLLGEGTLDAQVGDTLMVKENMPDFSIKDFLKDLMQRYFLTPVVDNVARTITFRSFDELYANKATARIWSKKFVNDARQDEFIFGSYAQKNNFTWKEDQKLLDNGEGYFLINNQTLPQSTDSITSIFANTDYTSNVLGGQTVALIDKYNNLPNVATGFEIDTEWRLVQIRDANPGFYTLKLAGGPTMTINNLRLGFFWSPSDEGIGWKNQIANFATGFLKLINNVRAITRYAVLTPVDIANFDFFTPVYDELEAKYYYVNQINNFVIGQKTKVSLIRM